ncbi:MAG: hypothetical protein IPP59_03860 [Betaproteobacteria bacterium]|jgi:hypothetical protein|nr:hypothetical protein [Betaproteobacteria bacterium]MBK9783384.1 hypothetical protein [Candidatus Dechloromonas phosphorivorans]
MTELENELLNGDLISNYEKKELRLWRSVQGISLFAVTITILSSLILGASILDEVAHSPLKHAIIGIVICISAISLPLLALFGHHYHSMLIGIQTRRAERAEAWAKHLEGRLRILEKTIGNGEKLTTT